MRHVKALSVLVVLAVLASMQWSAQAAPLSQEVGPPVPGQPDGNAALLAQLAQVTDDHVRVSHHAETGNVRFIGTDPRHPIQRPAGTASTVSSEQAARAFLSQYGSLFGIQDQAHEVRMLRTRTVQRNGFTRFQQTYQGVPVLGAEVSVHTTTDANVVSAHGEIVPHLAVDTTPRLTATQAQTIARDAIARNYKLPAHTFTATAPQLWIYNPLTLGGPGIRRNVLVWRMDVEGQGKREPVRELVLIDAHIGALALNFNQIAHGKDRRVCDAENVPDPEPFSAYQCVPERYDRVEGQPPTGVADVDRAYDQHGAVYDYYFRNFGRDSIDNNGLPLIATVRYCPLPNDPDNPDDDAFCPYLNAFWDGQQMTYGDGLVLDDVVAHELTHGVTQYESNLFYYYQSGAINESLSDVFGELFDLQYAAGGRDTDTPDVRWQIGEEIVREDLDFEGPFRDMQNPEVFGDPDRVRSPHYWNKEDDQGGVHINSGINNKAAYLMTDGDTFNGYTITGIGAYKTAYIYYVANTQYLLSASDYQDLADILPQACDFLAQSGIAITTADDCGEVRDAVLATEMDLRPRNALQEAPVCEYGQAPTDVFFDNLEHPERENWAITGQGEANGWYYPGALVGLQYARSGMYNFAGYADVPEAVDARISMTRDVIVPQSGFMHFHHSWDFQVEGERDERGEFTSITARNDGGRVEYSTDGGKTYRDAGPFIIDNGYNGTIRSDSAGPLAGKGAWTNRSRGYTASRLNLRSLAGQSVRFRFRYATDDTTDPLFFDAGWYIDDIRVYSCGTAAPSAHRVYVPMTRP